MPAVEKSSAGVGRARRLPRPGAAAGRFSIVVLELVVGLVMLV
jgi:hypothetical protein